MKLKKILCGILAATVITVSAVPVFAGTITAAEQGIMNKLSQTVTGPKQETYTIPGGYLNQASNYLLDNDLTDTEIASINGNIDEAINVAKTEGLSSAAAKEKVMGFAQAAAKTAGITLTFNADGSVTANVPADKKGGTTPAITTKPVVKATGAAVDGTNAVVAMTALAGILAVAGYSISKNKLMER